MKSFTITTSRLSPTRNLPSSLPTTSRTQDHNTVIPEIILTVKHCRGQLGNVSTTVPVAINSPSLMNIYDVCALLHEVKSNVIIPYHQNGKQIDLYFWYKQNIFNTEMGQYL
uniref:Uncharacterized protein n=1 Tax=Megaselia scalaris TaxID=36166 RepID=T1GV17_MEGSC